MWWREAWADTDVERWLQELFGKSFIIYDLSYLTRELHATAVILHVFHKHRILTTSQVLS